MKLLEDYIQKDELVWQQLFYEGQFSQEYKNDTTLKPIFDFLFSKVSFWYYKICPRITLLIRLSFSKMDARQMSVI